MGGRRYDSVLKEWYEDFLREGHKWRDIARKNHVAEDRIFTNSEWFLWLYTYLNEDKVKFAIHNAKHDFSIILYFDPYTKLLIKEEIGYLPRMLENVNKAVYLMNRVLEIFEAPFWLVFNRQKSRLEKVYRKKTKRIYYFVRLARLVTSVSPQFERAREEYMRLCRIIEPAEGEV